MSKSKIIFFVVLAAAGTGAMVLYAARVFPAAPSSFQLAILIFTGIAAVVGFLGLLVSYLTYRIEAGRVPKPDIAIRLPDGSWSRSLSLDAAFIESSEAFDDLVAERKSELDEAAKVARPHPLVGDVISASFQYDGERYQRDVERHIRRYREYLELKELWDNFWRRSYVTVVGFTNDKAGVPASGIKVAVHFPEDDEGMRILRLADLPEQPGEPERPAPPKPDTTFGLGGFNLSRFTPTVPRIDFPNISPPGNVSGPEIGRGSVLVSYTVQELLHNTLETTEEDPIVVSFLRPGEWTIPYEVHARNLPVPKKSTFMIEVLENPEAPSYEPVETNGEAASEE